MQLSRVKSKGKMYFILLIFITVLIPRITFSGGWLVDEVFHVDHDSFNVFLNLKIKRRLITCTTRLKP